MDNIWRHWLDLQGAPVLGGAKHPSSVATLPLSAKPPRDDTAWERAHLTRLVGDGDGAEPDTRVRMPRAPRRFLAKTGSHFANSIDTVSRHAA